jgi:hypothetical protein
MRCPDERCTGNHNDRRYYDLCPRTKEDKRQQNKRERAKNRDHYREYEMVRRGTAKNMLAKARYDASRRGGRNREATFTD